jgi:hypothetical protein
MNRYVKYLGQGLFYSLFMGVVGYFSTSPAYSHLPPDEALIKLSFSHAGQHKGACRERTPEELAKLPQYQRKVTMVCPRERSDVVVELDLDGKQLYHVALKPGGFSSSGTSNIYRRIAVKAGKHTLTARLKDREGEEFNYSREETVMLEAGRIMVIDFKAETGGFIFQNMHRGDQS